VNPEFWQAFVPAILARAKVKGIAHFHIFGEIAYEEPTATLAAQVMAESGLPYALDMGFAKAAQLVASGKAGPRLMTEFLQQDAIYPGGAATALGLPTFLGNHDFGRFSMFVRQMSGSDDEGELLARVTLSHAMMFGLRGVPTIYNGDEQGFISDGNDQLAREDMFPSKVATYNDNNLIGSDATTAQSNFETDHPLYRLIADLARARSASRALRRGLTEVRAFEESAPGLLAVERHDPETGQRVLLAFKTGASPPFAPYRGKLPGNWRHAFGGGNVRKPLPHPAPCRSPCRRSAALRAFWRLRNNGFGYGCGSPLCIGQTCLVARRRDLPDLPSLLSRHQWRRDRRSGRDRRAAGLYRRSRRERHLDLALLHLADEGLRL
jgi:glycosidase